MADWALPPGLVNNQLSILEEHVKTDKHIQLGKLELTINLTQPYTTLSCSNYPNVLSPMTNTLFENATIY